MRAVVTGAAGFIGSNVVDAILEAGHDVLGIDDLRSGHLENLESAAGSGRFEMVIRDITDRRLRDDFVAFEPDVICHLAAAVDVRRSVLDPMEDARINVLGTIGVLEAARIAGASRTVYVTSGGAIYGETHGRPASEDFPVAPESPYGASKAAPELWLGVYERLHSMQWVALALSNVYGPRQSPEGEGGVVAIFGAAAQQREGVTIFGDGRQTRDFLYVGDVARAVVMAAEGAGAGRLNLGTGVETSVAELHALIGSLAGLSMPAVHAPARGGEIRRTALDARAATAALGWEPLTTLDDGLKHTLRWLSTREAD
jgi:UDP-glucose 4-epimerase